MWRVIAVCTFFAIFSQPVEAVVVLNEVSPRTSPEWIELYNTGPDPVDLTGWYYLDAASNRKNIDAPEPVGANTYYLSTPYTSWLNNDGDSLYLYDNSDNLIDSLQFGQTKADTSVARVPDITGSWLLDQPQTALASNAAPTPTPSASPSPSPVPSPSPSPLPSAAATAQSPVTPTPSPSPSATPIVAFSPSAKISSSSIPSPSPTGGSDATATVAGVSDIDLSGYGMPSIDTSPPPKDSTDPTLSLNRSRLKLLITTSLGIIVLAVAAYLAYRQKKKNPVSAEL